MVKVSLSRISCCLGNSVVTSQTELGDVGPDLPGSTILPKTTGTFRWRVPSSMKLLSRNSCQLPPTTQQLCWKISQYVLKWSDQQFHRKFTSNYWKALFMFFVSMTKWGTENQNWGIITKLKLKNKTTRFIRSISAPNMLDLCSLLKVRYTRCLIRQTQSTHSLGKMCIWSGCYT